jgi:hypothetical protein
MWIIDFAIGNHSKSYKEKTNLTEVEVDILFLFSINKSEEFFLQSEDSLIYKKIKIQFSLWKK